MKESIIKILLRDLSIHFGQPVKPVEKYCESLEIWAKVILEKYENEKKLGKKSSRGYEEYLHYLLLDISKSNLLARLIYGDLPLRTIPCPEHKGRWSGCFGECSYGCELTGWLPEPSELKKEKNDELIVLDIQETRAKVTVRQFTEWLINNDWFSKKNKHGPNNIRFWSNDLEFDWKKCFALPTEEDHESKCKMMEVALYIISDKINKSCAQIVEEMLHA